MLADSPTATLRAAIDLADQVGADAVLLVKTGAIVCQLKDLAGYPTNIRCRLEFAALNVDDDAEFDRLLIHHDAANLKISLERRRAAIEPGHSFVRFIKNAVDLFAHETSMFDNAEVANGRS